MQNHNFHGFSLKYPSDWEIVEQEEGEGNEPILMIQSPETSFWMMQLFPNAPAPDEVLSTAADAICDEYDDVDVYSVDVKINGEERLGMDLEFECVDLMCTASLRAFPIEEMTVLVYTQWADQEKETMEHFFEEMMASLEHHNEA